MTWMLDPAHPVASAMGCDALTPGEVTCTVGGWTAPRAWEEAGPSIGTGERFMTTIDWFEWCELVRDVADDRGAWFVLGMSTDADEFVLQVPPVKGISLHQTLMRHNIRECRFFRLARNPEAKP